MARVKENQHGGDRKGVHGVVGWKRQGAFVADQIPGAFDEKIGMARAESTEKRFKDPMAQQIGERHRYNDQDDVDRRLFLSVFQIGRPDDHTGNYPKPAVCDSNKPGIKYSVMYRRIEEKKEALIESQNPFKHIGQFSTLFPPAGGSLQLLGFVIYQLGTQRSKSHLRFEHHRHAPIVIGDPDIHLVTL